MPRRELENAKEAGRFKYLFSKRWRVRTLKREKLTKRRKVPARKEGKGRRREKQLD